MSTDTPTRPGGSAGAPGTADSSGSSRGLRRVLPSLRRSRRRDLQDVPGRADVLALSALLLAYPDAGFLAARDDLSVALSSLPDSLAADHLRAFWAQTGRWEAQQAQQHYVEVFDLRRATAPYLTYYLHGDTRRRGAALLALKQAYRAHGFVPPEDELPDHLPVVLEFAARAGAGAGEAALRSHRAGFEVLRTELTRKGSPYHRVLDAVAAVLGPAGEQVTERARKIAADGPPTDDVGLGSPLDGYGAGFLPDGSPVPGATPYPPASCGLGPARPQGVITLDPPTSRPRTSPEGL